MEDNYDILDEERELEDIENTEEIEDNEGSEEDSVDNNENEEETEETEQEPEEKISKKDKKIRILVERLNKEFFRTLEYYLIELGKYIKNKSFREIFDAFRSDDIHYRKIIHHMYTIICEIYHYLYISVDLDELIETYSSNDKIPVLYSLELVKSFIKNNMSKLNIISDTMGIKRYFTPEILNSEMFTKEFLEKYDDYELDLQHPVIDIIETNDLNPTIEKVMFAFTENLNKFKRLYIKEIGKKENFKITKENYKNMFGIFVYSVQMFFQMFSVGSYLSKNRKQIHMNIHNNILKSCPEIDNIYNSDYSKEFLLYHIKKPEEIENKEV